MGKKRSKSVFTVIAFALLFISIFFFLYTFSNVQKITGFDIFTSQTANVNDAYIWSSFPDNKYPSSLRIGKPTSGEYRGLIKIDVSSIPQADTVTSANLSLYASTLSGTPTISVYKLTSPWLNTETTWNNESSSSSWSTPGGDYGALIGTFTVTTNNAWYNITLTSTLQNWVHGQNNYGLILIADSASSGNYTYFSSSTSPSNQPTLTVAYTSNAPPILNSVSTDTGLLNPKQVGQQITFSINWTDLENDNSKIFICNSSSINYSGCNDKTFCSTSLSSSNPAACSYTTQQSDNKTNAFYAAACDSGSGNCTPSGINYFYVNHPPALLLIQPNGGETVNQSNGNYPIIFNVSDSDSDPLSASIYVGPAQGSTSGLIASQIPLLSYCTDSDLKTSTPNNCTYSWDSTGLYGNYYITILLNDSFSSVNSSSSSPFEVRSLTDTSPPEIIYQNITPGKIYSGQQIQISSGVIEPNFPNAWVSIDSSQNFSMTNTEGTTFITNYTATTPGTHTFKVYATNILGNLNDSMPTESFTVLAPQIQSQNQSSPATALPYSVILISSQINATNPINSLTATLNSPEGFSFLSETPKTQNVGNIFAGQTKTILWFLSVPKTESLYTLNISYSDPYTNSWQSDNLFTTVTSAIGGGYTLTASGYPSIVRGDNYTIQAFFTQGSSYIQPDNATLEITDPLGTIYTPPTPMLTQNLGILNSTVNIGTSVVEGQWKAAVNVIKSNSTYYAQQFFNVVGGLFDVSNITILNTSKDNLQIAVIVENKGQSKTDMWLVWNLTKYPSGDLIDSKEETFAVQPGEQITKTNSFSASSYSGPAKITIIGYYPSPSFNEKAGASEIFSITDSSTNSGGNSGSGGGGGSSGGSSGGGSVQTQVSTKAQNTTAQFSQKWFLDELKRLKDKASSLNSTDCNSVILALEDNINKEQYIDAKENINKADTCLQDVEDKLNGVKEVPLINVKMNDYWLWIVTWVLIALLILLVLLAIYILYRKVGLAAFIKNEQSALPKKDKKDFEKDYVDNKIKSIEDKLKK